jgi:tRNA splicing ligase
VVQTSRTLNGPLRTPCYVCSTAIISCRKIHLRTHRSKSRKKWSRYVYLQVTNTHTFGCIWTCPVSMEYTNKQLFCFRTRLLLVWLQKAICLRGEMCLCFMVPEQTALLPFYFSWVFLEEEGITNNKIKGMSIRPYQHQTMNRLTSTLKVVNRIGI